MSKAENEAAIRELAARYPQLASLVDDYVEWCDGEMLPHLIMGEVIVWLTDHLESDHAVCVSILAWMEAKFIEGPAEVRNLLSVSAVENIPAPGERGSQLRDMLGPSLRKEDMWLDHRDGG